MPSASPSATTTIRTSSSSELDADDFLPSKGLFRVAFTGGPGLALGGGGLLGDGSLVGGRRLGRSVCVRGRGRLRGVRGLLERLLVDRLARHLRIGRRGRLGGGIVQQPGLDDLLRPRVAALAYAGALADPAAQVVELRAPDVAAGGDLDPLDLRRMQRERALDTDAEGLLAHGERLPYTFALALDDDALEDLRAATRALDDLEVDPHPIAGGELRDPAQLRALEAVDDGAHRREKPRANGDLAEPAYGSEGPGSRAWLCSRRHRRIRSWWPDSRTSGTLQPRHSA